MSAPLTIKFVHSGVFRRVTVDMDPQANDHLAQLTQAIKNLVPDFSGQLAWKDVDGDLIVIGTNEELKEAMLHLKGDCLKLELIPPKQAERSEESKEQPKPKTCPEFGGFPFAGCGQGAPLSFLAQMMGGQHFGGAQFGGHQSEEKPSEEEVVAHLQAVGKQIEGMIETFMGVKVNIEVTKKANEEKMDESKPAETAPSTSAASSSAGKATSAKPNLMDVLQQMTAGHAMPQSFPEDQQAAKVAETMDQLTKMGYSNEGGWLTALVTAKHGNINAVLNAMAEH